MHIILLSSSELLHTYYYNLPSSIFVYVMDTQKMLWSWHQGFGIAVMTAIVLFVVIGFATSVFVKGESENFFVAGRSLPLWVRSIICVFDVACISCYDAVRLCSIPFSHLLTRANKYFRLSSLPWHLKQLTPTPSSVRPLSRTNSNSGTGSFYP